jgi:predicted nucleotidyltransferase
MIGIVEDRRAEVAALCERYGVKRLDLFGSAAGDGFDPEASDLECLEVEFCEVVARSGLPEIV